MNATTLPYAVIDIVVAASTGGEIYHRLLGRLPADFPAAVVEVQHRSPGTRT